MRILTILFIFQLVFKPILPLVEYVIRYDYIKKELCENKKKPILKCEGKCHLKKQLSKEADTKNPTSETKKQAHTVVELLFCQANPSFSFFPEVIHSKKNQFLPYRAQLAHGYLQSLDIPPSV